MSPKIIFLTPLPVPPYTPPIPASHPLKLLQPSAFWVFYHGLPVYWSREFSLPSSFGLVDSSNIHRKGRVRDKFPDSHS